MAIGETRIIGEQDAATIAVPQEPERSLCRFIGSDRGFLLQS